MMRACRTMSATPRVLPTGRRDQRSISPHCATSSMSTPETASRCEPACTHARHQICRAGRLGQTA